MASKEMREIEALNEDSVPLSIDDRERVSAANRYFQIGSGACSALLDSALNGTSPEPRQVILLDLFVHTVTCWKHSRKCVLVEETFTIAGFVRAKKKSFTWRPC